VTHQLTASSCLVLLTFLSAVDSGRADVLIGVNGERFVGKVVESSAEVVIFQSEIGGRLTIPRRQVRELQLGESSVNSATNSHALPLSQSGSASAPEAKAWQPPGLGKDGFDWLMLKTQEWLRGHLRYVQDKKVSFESDKLEELTFDLKDVHYLYSGKPMFTKFDGKEQVYGTVMLTTNLVEVIGPEQVELARDRLTGITPGGKREIQFWSGKLNVGLNFQSGNTKQTSINASGELARRTPATQFLLDYMGNYGEVEEVQNANNHRISLSYDVRLSRKWFVRPVQAEYYRDPLANIAHRGTVGSGFGHYVFDEDALQWKVAAGPGYQLTRFETVEAGEDDSASTAAGILSSSFEADITSRLTFIHTFAATLASPEAGLYSHHFVATLEFEVKKSLDLNVSFVWDYLQNPQTDASGDVPKHSDLRLTVGLGVKF